jgi:type III secretion protein N (ATPase)
VGEYEAGSDPVADEAIRKMDAIRGFLMQRTDERCGMADTLAQLKKLVGAS